MPSTATKRKPADDLAVKAKKVLRSLELGADHYQRADALLKEIALELEPGQSIELPNGKKAVLKDRFAGTDIVWQPCAARRWKLEVVAA